MIHNQVSVIVTVYNSGDLLKTCLQSIENQKEVSLEIIIIIDGSDNKLDYDYSYSFKKESKFPVIIVENQENIGTSKSRKKGIDVSSGDYIGFVDADDYVHPQCFSILYNLAIENYADIVISNYVKKNVWDLDDFKKIPTRFSIDYLSGRELFEQQILRVDRPYYLRVDWWNKIYKREIFKTLELDFPKVVRNEGIISMLYSLVAKKCLIVDLDLFVTTTREDSVCRSYKRKNIVDIVESIRFFRTILKRMHLLNKYYDLYNRFFMFIVFDHNIQMIMKSLNKEQRAADLKYLLDTIKGSYEVYSDLIYYLGLRDKNMQLLVYSSISVGSNNWDILSKMKNTQFYDRVSLISNRYIQNNIVNNPDVTVITICKDLIHTGRKQYFSKMVKTVREQSFKGSIEHLVLDASSKDGTIEYLQELFERGFITNVYSEPDNGIYNAMNKAVMLSKGRYVIFLNSDDYLDKYAIESLYTLIKNSGADYSFADAYKVDENENFVGSHRASLSKVFFGSPYCHQTLLCDKKVFKELYYDESYNITMWKFAFDLYSEYVGVGIEKKLAYFRVGGISTDPKWVEQFKEEQRRVKELVASELGLPFDIYLFIDSLFRKYDYDKLFSEDEIRKYLLQSKSQLKNSFIFSVNKHTSLNV